MYVMRPANAPFSIDATAVVLGHALKDIEISLDHESESNYAVYARVYMPAEGSEPYMRFEIHDQSVDLPLPATVISIEGIEEFEVCDCIGADGSFKPLLLSLLEPCAQQALRDHLGLIAH